MKAKIFFIPDIHGRLELLEKLLAELHVRGLDLTRDKIIFGGDYVDRGLYSREVLNTVHNLVARHKRNVIALAGNHEWLMIDACKSRREGSDEWSDQWYLWMMNGGDATIANYEGGINNTTLREHVKWLASLPLSHEEPGFFFSHAPVPRENRRLLVNRGMPYTKQELTWTYGPNEAHLFANLEGPKVGVCGHIHQVSKQLQEGKKLAPRFYETYIFADAGCGCYPKAPLVAVEVQSREVVYAHPEEEKASG
jgi:Icc-related predicted phosphoesterase